MKQLTVAIRNAPQDPLGGNFCDDKHLRFPLPSFGWLAL